MDSQLFDIISKEMFTWEDSKGRNISLRPENTASIARAMISSGRIHNNANLPERLYYHGSMFRRERPQKGRLREFTQFGVESIGTISTHEDIDVLSMAYDYLSNLGFYNNNYNNESNKGNCIKTTLLINTLGDHASRNNYQELLNEYFNAFIDISSEMIKFLKPILFLMYLITFFECVTQLCLSIDSKTI